MTRYLGRSDQEGDAVRQPRRAGYVILSRGSRRNRNVFGLPDGPWFPWSREFRWDLMPWNRGARRDDEEHRRRRELIHLVEAAAGTIAVLARDAGFGFNSATTGMSNDGVSHAVLYEASPRSLADRYPALAEGDPPCIDLWIYWYPDLGQLEVNLLGFGGMHGVETADRHDLDELLHEPVTDRRRLRPVLEAWAESLEAWLQKAEG